MFDMQCQINEKGGAELQQEIRAIHSNQSYPIVSNHIQTLSSLSNPIQACKKLSKRILPCQKLSKPVQVCQKLSKPIQACHKLSNICKPVKYRTNISKPAKKLSKHIQNYSNLSCETFLNPVKPLHTHPDPSKHNQTLL